MAIIPEGPEGTGSFPAVVYNHGSAAGMLSRKAFEVLGPVFASHGWVFFGPYRRGQGLSAAAGPYIGNQIAAARKSGGISAGATAMVKLLKTDHLNDQLSALAWLRKQSFIQADRVAVAGNSFGGIETVLGAERGESCAAVASAGAQSWKLAPELQALMIGAVRNAKALAFEELHGLDSGFPAHGALEHAREAFEGVEVHGVGDNGHGAGEVSGMGVRPRVCLAVFWNGNRA